jgi:hypothetical protein
MACSESTYGLRGARRLKNSWPKLASGSRLRKRLANPDEVSGSQAKGTDADLAAWCASCWEGAIPELAYRGTRALGLEKAARGRVTHRHSRTGEGHGEQCRLVLQWGAPSPLAGKAMRLAARIMENEP